jgi:uncharacterized protein YaiI (UPF0178 family)
MTKIYVDADACPVKDEIYRVAARYSLEVYVVSNSWIRTPKEPLIFSIVVDAGPDIADDWIAERATVTDIVVTSDIPLAERVLKGGAEALSPKGRLFTSDNIGASLASRAVGEHLRSIGTVTSGPSAFAPADRSRFLQALDAAVIRARRRHGPARPAQ